MAWDLGTIRKNLEFTEKTKGEIKSLFHPYYIINITLSTLFLFTKLTHPICDYLFSVGPEQCELDMRETEILFFLLVIIMIRSRKTGSTSLISYLSNGFVYAKGANIILFFLADPRLGLVYTLLVLLQGMLVPEPTYKGPENITYFRANSLGEELARDTKVVWLVTFYASWSPACINFSTVFAKLSADYSLPNLKFGKVDVGRYPEQAEQYHVNASALSQQLPTMVMFQDGKEMGRVPAIVSGKVQKFFFKEEDLVLAFDMNNLYQKCKEDKRFVPTDVREANREAKKEK